MLYIGGGNVMNEYFTFRAQKVWKGQGIVILEGKILEED
jgi:hypothetical protein